MSRVPGGGVRARLAAVRNTLTSENRHARFALATIAASMLAGPLDRALRIRERRLLSTPTPPGPVVIVCGAPRSGTTLTAQVLSRRLPVTYPTNVMDVFPTAPISASAVFRCDPDPSAIDTTSFYGRSRGKAGRSDVLNIWDRFLTGDRATPDRELSDPQGLAAFVGSLAARWGRPIVLKNNGANTFAHHVVEALPEARFLCLEREPLYNAQSLLVARRTINANEAQPYGVEQPIRHSDPLEDVAEQIAFHRETNRAQAQRLGADRFKILSYEDFCRDPDATVRWAGGVLGVDPLPGTTPGFTASTRQTLPDDEFRRLEQAVTNRIEKP